MSLSDATIDFMKKASFDQTVAPCSADTNSFIDILEEFLETKGRIEADSKKALDRRLQVHLARRVVKDSLRSVGLRDALMDLIVLNAADATFENVGLVVDIRPWTIRDRILPVLEDVYSALLTKLIDAAPKA